MTQLWRLEKKSPDAQKKKFGPFEKEHFGKKEAFRILALKRRNYWAEDIVPRAKV